MRRRDEYAPGELGVFGVRGDFTRSQSPRSTGMSDQTLLNSRKKITVNTLISIANDRPSTAVEEFLGKPQHCHCVDLKKFKWKLVLLEHLKDHVMDFGIT